MTDRQETATRVRTVANTSRTIGGTYRAQNNQTMTDKRRCNGCGVTFRPRLDGSLCPTCVEIVITNNLDPDDWEQYKLREEYEV